MDWIFDEYEVDEHPFADSNEAAYHPRPQESRHQGSYTAQGTRLGVPQSNNSSGSLSEAQMLLQSLTPAERAVLPATLNPMQEMVLPSVLGSDDSVVLSAPTGAGKTCVLDMAVLRSLIVDGCSRIYYIAPSRALCRLQSIGFSNRFRGLNLRVDLVTGDDTADEDDEFTSNRRRDYLTTKITSLFTGSNAKQCARLIACTPEKLEAETRRCSDEKLAGRGKVLILVDEVHHIGERDRGAVLELVLTRFLWALRKQRSMVRFVAVSATIPNVAHVAKWLNNARHFEFTQRPVPLFVHVHGYVRNPNRPDYLFEQDLDRYVPEVLRNYSTGKPALVFVSSRKGAKDLAMKLRESGFGNRSLASRDIVAQDDTLTECLRVGIGFHTAGLSANDRTLVENLFRESKLKVVCCTSTLAVGVDLPANLVVIKSTRAYRGAALGFQDIERATLIQMIGRAGRPGYDTEGIAVIMTANGEEHKFESLSQGLEAVESRFDGNALREGLNAEIVRGRIKSMYDAIEWWSMTFAYASTGKPWDASELDQLLELGCIRYNDNHISTTPVGRIASSHHLLVSTVAHFARIVSLSKEETVDESQQQDWSLEKALRAICDDEEFKDLIPRRDQKKFLNNIAWNLGRFKSPKSTRIGTGSEVAFQLIQARLGGIAITDNSLRLNSIFTNERAPRLARALLKMLIDARSNRAIVCSLLCKCLDAGSWESEEISQLDGIGPKTREKLVQQGITTLRQVVLPANASLVPQRSVFHAKQILNTKRQPHVTVVDNALVISLNESPENNVLHGKTAKSQHGGASDWWVACLSEPSGQVLDWSDRADRLVVSMTEQKACKVLAIHRKVLGIDTLLDIKFGLRGNIQELVTHDASFWNRFTIPTTQTDRKSAKKTTKVTSSKAQNSQKQTPVAVASTNPSAPANGHVRSAYAIAAVRQGSVAIAATASTPENAYSNTAVRQGPVAISATASGPRFCPNPNNIQQAHAHQTTMAYGPNFEVNHSSNVFAMSSSSEMRLDQENIAPGHFSQATAMTAQMYPQSPHGFDMRQQSFRADRNNVNGRYEPMTQHPPAPSSSSSSIPMANNSIRYPKPHQNVNPTSSAPAPRFEDIFFL